MIITRQDIDEFTAAIEDIGRQDRYRENIYGAKYDGYEDEIELNAWLANNPQVLMAGAAMQEFVGAHKISLYEELVKANFIPRMEQPAFRPFGGNWILASHRGDEGVYAYSVERLRYAVAQDDDELFEAAITKLAEPNEIIQKAERFIDCPMADPTVFTSPRLWTPYSQDVEKSTLQSTAVPLIEAVNAEKRELASVSWSQLEEIVAEIFRQKGMEVHLVSESPQGGRDIIARTRGEFGEVLTMAIEVKHEAKTGRPALHKALHQNNHFPALMFVTSGRFTAGVYQEAKKPENRYRLILKDGVAIRDMIRTQSH